MNRGNHFDERGHLWIEVDLNGIPPNVKVTTVAYSRSEGPMGWAVTHFDFTQYMCDLVDARTK